MLTAAPQVTPLRFWSPSETSVGRVVLPTMKQLEALIRGQESAIAATPGGQGQMSN